MQEGNDPRARHRGRWGVVIVEPLAVVRAGLAALVGLQDDLESLAQAGSAEAALAAIAKVRRTRVIVLVGLSLEGPEDASWLIREVRERYPALAVLAMGADADPTAISRALFVGADGFVDKSAEPADFLGALRRAGSRETVLAGTGLDVVGMIADGLERRRDIELVLTRREREVLAIAADGLTAREIAVRLNVRERTVTTHLSRIYAKLGVGGRLAAVRLAARSGLVSVGTPD
ncbi:MAG: LuxR C-terminal-related transcriptional regulator [Actinomycetota bacterium]|jgi:DNA-binding NarL/FixJ family response regulator